MNLYIDKNNFVELGKSVKSDKEMQRMIKENCKIILGFPESDINKMKKKEKETTDALMKILTSGMSKGKFLFPNENEVDRVFTELTTEKVAKMGLEERIETLSSVFLVDYSGKTNDFSGNLLISKGIKPFQCLRNLYIDERYIPCKLYKTKDWTTSWDIYKGNSSPCTDIVILDKYIFSKETDTIDDKNKMYENICGLIYSLHSSWENSVFIPNVIIFTGTPHDDDPKKILFKPDQLIEELKGYFKKQYSKDIKVTLVTKNFEHDRTILTNYKLIDNGDSFTFVTRDNDKRYGRWGHIHSLVDDNNRELFYEFLKELQAQLDKGMDVYGDKQSYLLRFQNNTQATGI